MLSAGTCLVHDWRDQLARAGRRSWRTWARGGRAGHSDGPKLRAVTLKLHVTVSEA